MHLTKTFAADHFMQALESWAWLDISGKRPLFASSFGNVFFQANDGAWLLDIVKGSLSRPWEDGDRMEADLATDDGRERYLLASLAIAAADSGIVLAAHEIYDFSTPPALGGQLNVDDLTAMDFVVAVNLAGRIHTQVRDLPAGTDRPGQASTAVA